MSSYPLYLLRASQCFFGLSDAQLQSPEKIDPYWQVSPCDILAALQKIFGDIKILRHYLPRLSSEKAYEFVNTRRTVPITEVKGEKTLVNISSTPLKLVGICGSMHHGKTTVAEHMVSEHHFTEYAFASSLKEGCEALFGFTPEQVWTNLKDQEDCHWGISPRYVLQHVGTDIFRNDLKRWIPNIYCPSTLWVENFKRWVTKRTGNVVVSDVRFLDEAKCIKALGGTIVRVERPSLYTSGQVHNHASETDMYQIQPDIVLMNGGTLDNLFKKVDDILFYLSKSGI